MVYRVIHCFRLHRIEPENEYYDGEKDQDRDGAEEKT